MDKYLTNYYRRASEGNSSKSKQSTIYDLKGVVKLDEILGIKAKLKNRQLADEDVLICLRRLSDKIPPRSVLASTRIEHKIKRWTKHKTNKEISQLALFILKKWTDFYANKDRLPLLDVKCDKKTDHIRKSSRRYLNMYLKGEADKESRQILIESLDREVFYRTKLLVKYTPMMRRVGSLLKEDGGLRAGLLDKSLRVKEFVDDLINNKQ